VIKPSLKGAVQFEMGKKGSFPKVKIEDCEHATCQPRNKAAPRKKVPWPTMISIGTVPARGTPMRAPISGSRTNRIRIKIRLPCEMYREVGQRFEWDVEGPGENLRTLGNDSSFDMTRCFYWLMQVRSVVQLSRIGIGDQLYGGHTINEICH